MMATRLFGFFPRSEANDPETFIAGAAAMLMRYPEAIVRGVCDPVRGLPGTNKFFSLAELREVCEREMVWHDVVVKREREREHTRRILDSRKAPVGSPEHQNVVNGYEELTAALAPKIAPRRAPPPDARYAATPGLEAQAAATHAARLEELAQAPPARLSAALAAKFAPPGPSDAWPGPPQPAAAPGPSWARADEDDDAVGF
jgi:hypothetical protein